jgi:flagellar hook-associated protein 3 FlgL
MLRVSTNMLYQQGMQHMNHSQQALMRSSEQLSSGKRVVNPSDDPHAAAESVVVLQSEEENIQYKTIRSFAASTMELEDTVLGQVVVAIQNIQTKIIYAGDGILSDNERMVLAKELTGLRQHMFALANSVDSQGRYIFAGFLNDKPAFVFNPVGSTTVFYQGGTDPIQQQVGQVDTGRTMTISYTGNTIFQTLPVNPVPEPPGNPLGPSEPDVFVSVELAITALMTPTQNASSAVRDLVLAQIAKAHRGVMNSLTNVVSIRTELGVQLQELEQLNSLSTAKSLSNATRVSELTDTNFYEATSDFSRNKTTLQAAMSVFNTMKNMSLFDTHR